MYQGQHKNKILTLLVLAYVKKEEERLSKFKQAEKIPGMKQIQFYQLNKIKVVTKRS